MNIVCTKFYIIKYIMIKKGAMGSAGSTVKPAGTDTVCDIDI